MKKIDIKPKTIEDLEIKVVKNRKRYNTVSSTLLAEHSEGSGIDRYIEGLYKKKITGELFLAGEGGPGSKYGSYSKEHDARISGSKIFPLTDEEAREWVEQTQDLETYDRIFPENEGEFYKYSLDVPMDIYTKAEERAREEGISMREVFIDALEAYLK